MCGIAGFVSRPGFNGMEADQICLAMTETLQHRGPDDSGTWVNADQGVALGHRRLSILDISLRGHQPMHSACGRYVVVYNGEIYNHLQLREELERKGHRFRGTSDTETLLVAVSEWGLEDAVSRFRGMFAIALWDKSERRLSLVRDRIGIKPVYYGVLDGCFVFASELKAVRAGFRDSLKVDRCALTSLFRHNYIPTPHCIYKGLSKLEPGTLLSFDPATGEVDRSVYWDIQEVWLRGAESPLRLSEAEAVEALQSLLSEAVELRTLSDVPVGAFLSGGVDSSAVTALMQRGTDRPIKTFSLGFREEKYDESGYARAVADHLGTDHIDFRLSSRELLESIPQYPLYWDEPFSDCGQLTALMISRLAKKHVTVCLSGDGGDELFFGYQRYFQCGLWSKIAKIPGPFRRAAMGVGRFLSGSSTAAGNLGLRTINRFALLGASDLGDCYRYQVSHDKYPEQLVLGGCEYSRAPFEVPAGTHSPEILMPMWDLKNYISDGILTKVDRASMAVGLEVRVPILDHKVVEFAASVPLSYKVRNDQGKHLLRQMLYRFVPEKLIDRPKMGFGVPLEHWLKDDLRDWAESLLDEALLQRQGYLKAKKVRSVWRAFLGGMPGSDYLVWDLLMFQSWLTHNTQGDA